MAGKSVEALKEKYEEIIRVLLHNYNGNFTHINKEKFRKKYKVSYDFFTAMEQLNFVEFKHEGGKSYVRAILAPENVEPIRVKQLLEKMREVTKLRISKNKEIKVVEETEDLVVRPAVIVSLTEKEAIALLKSKGYEISKNLRVSF